ncbi:diguanylate cyclase [Pleurocapsales cyanobacterium LEGE 06147]|nr:diguanylate cyclase [Pleurocapsales cyanobacterium LEGE 06147]
MNSSQDEEHKGKILLVDDRPDNLKLLSLVLEQKGYYTQEIVDGYTAIEVAREIVPDLILLDIMMPKIDGYQVCLSLKKYSQTKEIPIIFLSAVDDTIYKVKALELGGADYITKPFSLDEVVVRVEKQIEIQRLQKQLQQQNDLLQQEIYKRIQAETALRRANQQLKYLATTDSLTGTANRRRFDEYLKQEWQRLTRERAPIGLIVGDIDYFKLYNDTYGHQAGDRCLQQVARAILNSVKRSADLVARYGGEEFAIILPRTPLAGAIHVAHKIKTAVRQLNKPHEKSPVSNFVTVTQGVTETIPSHEKSPEVLIKVADRALYDAKKQGRDSIVSYPLS